MHYTRDIPLKGGSYIHARGLSVHHVYRHITVTASITTFMYISKLILSLGCFSFNHFHHYNLLQEHAAMALQYYTGVSTATALHSLLVLCLEGFTDFAKLNISNHIPNAYSAVPNLFN